MFWDLRIPEIPPFGGGIHVVAAQERFLERSDAAMLLSRARARLLT